MLPTSVTKAIALSGESNALSFCFEFDGENINNIEVMQSRVNVTNTTYDENDSLSVKVSFFAKNSLEKSPSSCSA
jgi:hypothetical protein